MINFNSFFDKYCGAVLIPETLFLLLPMYLSLILALPGTDKGRLYDYPALLKPESLLSLRKHDTHRPAL